MCPDTPENPAPVLLHSTDHTQQRLAQSQQWRLQIVCENRHAENTGHKEEADKRARNFRERRNPVRGTL